MSSLPVSTRLLLSYLLVAVLPLGGLAACERLADARQLGRHDLIRNGLASLEQAFRTGGPNAAAYQAEAHRLRHRTTGPPRFWSRRCWTMAAWSARSPCSWMCAS